MTESKINNIQPVKRQSNIELLRIVGMLMIIAHHYVVNSGITENLSFSQQPANTVFLTLFGMWGKTGINVFILISGYFMCTSSLTLRRYCKIAFEWIFYHYVIYFIMLAAGYETLSFQRIFRLLFTPFIYANGSGCFTSSFLIFYLFIPFLNIFIHSASRKEYRNLVLLLLFVFTVLSTFFFNTVIFGEVFWFIAVYFIGGYLRLYPPVWAQSLRKSAKLLFLSLLLCYLVSILSILIRVRLSVPIDPRYNYFVQDAHKLGAVLVGVFLFTTFKNLQINYSHGINLVAKTTFGILMIHANSDAWRTFMWRDLLHVNSSYIFATPLLIIRSLLIVSGVFICCSALDLLRICLIEKPVFRHFEFFQRMIQKAHVLTKKILLKLYQAATADH